MICIDIWRPPSISELTPMGRFGGLHIVIDIRFSVDKIIELPISVQTFKFVIDKKKLKISKIFY